MIKDSQKDSNSRRSYSSVCRSTLPYLYRRWLKVNRFYFYYVLSVVIEKTIWKPLAKSVSYSDTFEFSLPHTCFACSWNPHQNSRTLYIIMFKYKALNDDRHSWTGFGSDEETNSYQTWKFYGFPPNHSFVEN